MQKQNTGKTPEVKERVKRSEELTPDELATLRSHIASFRTIEDAVEAMGFKNRNTLTRISGIGSGHPDSIKKIREAINQPA